ncbi:hypothetical protein ACIGO8_33075 [Streptomyces sp. NPDC053493]|uniref:hypothetical protein n=1 Tax=Streptomyces sp. NPDC053493 TaxID=3365705 RepID=UPI0037CF8ACA
MDAGAAAVLAATVAGVSSAVGVTVSAWVSARTAISQAATTASVERQKLDAEWERRSFEARQAGYHAFRLTTITAVQQVIALAEGSGTVAAAQSPSPDETRVAAREARLSLLKDVLPLGSNEVADTAQVLCRELEDAYSAAAVVAAASATDDALASWEQAYAAVDARLHHLARNMGQVVFPR